MRFKRLSEWQFEVESETSDNTYHVSVNPEEPCHCTCPAWAIRRNKDVKQGVTSSPPGRKLQLGTCKHVTYILDHNYDWQTLVPSEKKINEVIARLQKTAKEMS